MFHTKTVNTQELKSVEGPSFSPAALHLTGLLLLLLLKFLRFYF